MLRYFPIINAVWFQLVWFSVILYQQQAIPFLLVSILLHLFVSPTRKIDFCLLILISLLGVFGDVLLSFAGVYQFANNALIPVWLILLWCHFGFAINHSLGWLSRFHLGLVALIGAIAGPLNYLAGHRFGVVDFSYSYQITLFIIGVIWAVNLPVFILIQRRLRERMNNEGKSYETINKYSHNSKPVNNK
ncbi:DUF2878 domain-containing protein [Aliivibrio finisterrensis]|uniref:DUF2878 domain-containing protein n=1 Tax=Aliivibrio finisterrensis TaxID=511998 RepID=A0A6N6RWP6_9GAMM|nr:DUF2878 domain-containing protein [Aliivibrio finisterrensis]KAB2825860.1 DUF2878 domain-containing protein [Aliivibrio finisterrensis]